MAPGVAGDRPKAHKGLEGRKTVGKLVSWVSKRESYLSLLCIVFSQEDGCLRVMEPYSC